MKDLLQKGNKKLKLQVVTKQKSKTDVIPTTPLYLPLPEYSQSISPLSQSSFRSEETTRPYAKPHQVSGITDLSLSTFKRGPPDRPLKGLIRFQEILCKCYHVFA